MFEKIIQIFKTKDLRDRFLFVLGIMVVFRLLANIPIPGIDTTKVFTDDNPLKTLFSFASLMTGGSMEQISMLMLGMGPYITATIIFQLLGMVIPALEELMKEGGAAGRKKINQYSRLFTVPLAGLQGFAMLTIFHKSGLIPELPLPTLISSLICIITGSVLVMWFGELISEKGIGDGVSLLIFAGIVSRLPVSIGNELMKFTGAPEEVFAWVGFVVVSLIMTAAVVLINEARRNIPVAYAKQVRGNKMFGGVSTYLPLSVNPTGVIPVIFAISFMVIPGTLFGFLGNLNGQWGVFFAKLAQYFNPSAMNPYSWQFLIYNVMYFLLIFGFTYFYAAVTFNPKDIADNLQKTGGFIPGIRPGERTAKYIETTLNRLLFLGAGFLGFVAVAPSLVRLMTNIDTLNFLVGGTSLLIVVAVVLDTIKKINAQLQMRDYETI